MTSPITNTVTDALEAMVGLGTCCAGSPCERPPHERDDACQLHGVREILTAALSTHPHSEREDRPTGREVPAGWMLVPIEPTQDMLDEAFSATAQDSSGDVHRLFRTGWHAMIHTAPDQAQAASERLSSPPLQKTQKE
jgi:hypothetical protein